MGIWKMMKLAELATIKYGKNQKTVQSDSGKIPIYGTGGLMGYATECLYNKESVLIGRKGTIDKVRYVNYPFWSVDTLFYTIINDDIIIPRFLYYRLLTVDFIKMNEGTTIPSLRAETLNRLELLIPDIKTQHQIVSVLSAYDDLIENNQKQIKLLEELAQRLYKEWFVDLRFPDYENTSIIDGVPEGWRIVRITELLDIKYGKDHKSLENGEVPVYGSGGIMRKVKSVLYSGESVLIPRKGSLNNILLVSGDFWTIDTMFYSVPKKENVMKYCYLVLSQIDMYSMNTGSAVPSMTTKILDGIKILLPSESVLFAFNQIVSKYFDMMKLLFEQNEKLKEVRDRLLPKLMNGEIDVSQIHI